MSNLYFLMNSPGKVNFNQYGSKITRLLQINKLGFAIPPGIALSAEFFKYLIQHCGTRPQVAEIIKNEAVAASLDQEFLSLFTSKRFDNLLPEIHPILKNISDKGFLVVRSAALVEDDKAFSYAGQFDSILNVSVETVWDAILSCYASWWSDRSVTYRKQIRRAACWPEMSILIQRQLNPSYAGILFTQNPVGQQGETVIELVEGLGNKLLAGTAWPERFYVNRIERTIQPCDSLLARKDNYIKQLIGKLADTGLIIEKHYKEPVDIEWAAEKEKIYILQVRPITSISPKGKANLGKKIAGGSPLFKSYFSRAIIEDLWADNMTPITSSIIFEELSEVYTFKKPMKKLGLDELAKVKGIEIFNGYAYLSCDLGYQLMEYLPKFIRVNELLRIFPAELRPQIQNMKFNYRKSRRVLAKLWRLFTEPAVFPFLTIRIVRNHMKRLSQIADEVNINLYEKMDRTELGVELERIILLLASLQEKNQWGYGYAVAFTWFLNHFALHTLNLDSLWLLTNLRKMPKNATTTAKQLLEKMRLLADKEIKNCLHSSSGSNYSEALRMLHVQFPNHEFTRNLDSYIDKYRSRSLNRDFIFPRLDENPEIIFHMLNLMQSSQEHEINYKGQTNKYLKTTKQRMLYPLLKYLTFKTRNFLALREDARYGLDQLFYRIRKILQAIARLNEFTEFNILPNAVFFLTLEELRELVNKPNQAKKYIPRLKKRSDAFLKNCQKTPSYYIFSQGDRFIKKDEIATNGTIKGIPASSGIAVGRVRIIKSPDEFGQFIPGELLVAFNTDPGWTPLLLASKGVVIEMGSILNHCAVIAREYGIPAVIGIPGITSLLKNGQIIEIRGETGEIKIIS